VVTLSIQNSQGPQIPVLLLKEGAKETKGKDAQQNNINAAKHSQELSRSTRHG
jgi:archaeal chaperonin